ncbi:myeloid leukemia factor-like [Daphnia carinata]|uniref:myeloid leukemia factor-like n=1 Tax=Daphnia carinata TaxID=120202 RepID=UPI00257FCA91|nr:myeloid leukemia factor-like [Daphnia carinata]
MFGSFLRDYGEDPFFAGTNQLMRQMDSMMNSMMQDPFTNMMPMHHQMMSIQPPPQRHSVGSMVPFGGMPGFPMGMVDPFGMPSIGQMFQSFGQSGFGGGASPMYSSSSLMTMTTGPDGQPQVYQASTTTRTAPGGVREVQRSVSDSRSGVRKMAVGRHLGERGHVVEKEQNYYTGDSEEREDFINIEEEEAHQFDEEWNRRARVHQGMHGPSRVEMSRPHHQSNSSSYMGAPLAITAGPSHEVDRPRSRHSTHSRGLGPDRNARKRDGNRSGKSRHETSM